MHMDENLLQCTLCSKSFTESNDLKQHLEIHSEKSFVCFECNKQFSCKRGLKEHMKIHKSKSFQCSICFKNFTQSYYVKKHMTIHTREKTFHCSECNKCYRYESSFLKHKKSHVDQKLLNEERDQDFLPKSYPIVPSCHSKDDYDLSSRPENKPPKEEDTVGMINPLSEVVDCSGEQFRCTERGESFSCRSHVDDHIRSHTRDKELQHSECHKLVKYERNLVSHEAHKEEKSLHCFKCNRNFSSKNYLRKHMVVHTRKKFVQCSECHKFISRKGNLTKHMRVHTQEKPYQCSDCSKCFPFKGDLIKHLRVHTGEKPFQCLECSKFFSQKGSLVEHMRVHTGEKPFDCSECSKSFSCKGNLKVHMKSHTGEKPFLCPNCHKSYRHKASLIKHMEVHIGKESRGNDLCNDIHSHKNGLKLQTSHQSESECVKSSPIDVKYSCHVTDTIFMKNKPILEVTDCDRVKKEIIDESYSMICKSEDIPKMFPHIVVKTEIKEEAYNSEEF